MDYVAALKTDRMQLVADRIDAGAGPGKLEIGTAGMEPTRKRKSKRRKPVKIKTPAGEIITGIISPPSQPNFPAYVEPRIYQGTPPAERRKILAQLKQQKIARIIAADDEWFMMS